MVKKTAPEIVTGGSRTPHCVKPLRGALVAVAVLVLLGGGYAAAQLTARPAAAKGRTDPGVATALASVTYGTLSSQQQLTGTIGFQGSYDVVNEIQGVYTEIPTVTQVVREGEVVFRVGTATQGDLAAVLFYGSTPAYRNLQPGESGPDVAQLNHALARLGYLHGGASADFTAATTQAVKDLQKGLGEPETGELLLGQAVFLPTALRVTSVTLTLGAAASQGQAVLAATSDQPQVVAQIDASLQNDVKAGEPVTITLPDESTLSGTVASISEAPPSGNSSTPATELDITPGKGADLRLLNGASVNVAVTTQRVEDALAVPVTALLAEPGGGYAVELAGSDHRLMPVHLGMFDDAQGLVQVTGAGLTPGEKIVVAGS